ncbi:zinc dependent phospholipase C family protein [uncultured Paenibacillus sp.]|uniref:zinc dependent phospholipase C family protein n=1 Tax=uncultured Paenibacillus sp. TaxID=227322 RepID=UPI0028D44DBE|nr:zinc dependent phospholipase C family protein [uncultured Paenibacillus sp.]
MPNLWTHLIFGTEVLERIGERELIRRPEHRKLFNMGCQGPDFLFYHNFLPWKKGRAMNRLGSAMHSRHCGPVLTDLLDAVAGRPADPNSPDPAVVYALGFVLHHTLDRNVHPYVFSRSGFRKWDHQRFEVMMDTLVVRSRLGLETWKTPVWKEIDTGGAFPEAIVDAFERIAASRYPELAGLIARDDWNRANRDMVRAQKLFHDPSGIRRALTFGRIEPLVYKKTLPPLDILNEQGRPWSDPTDGTTKRSEAFDAMWDKAMAESEAIIRTALAWLRSECDRGPHRESDPAAEKTARLGELRAKTAELIGNRSYETGLPCDSGARILYADPIWPDGRGGQPDKAKRSF